MSPSYERLSGSKLDLLSRTSLLSKAKDFSSKEGKRMYCNECSVSSNRRGGRVPLLKISYLFSAYEAKKGYTHSKTFYNVAIQSFLSLSCLSKLSFEPRRVPEEPNNISLGVV